MNLVRGGAAVAASPTKPQPAPAPPEVLVLHTHELYNKQINPETQGRLGIRLWKNSSRNYKFEIPVEVDNYTKCEFLYTKEVGKGVKLSKVKNVEGKSSEEEWWVSPNEIRELSGGGGGAAVAPAAAASQQGWVPTAPLFTHTPQPVIINNAETNFTRVLQWTDLKDLGDVNAAFALQIPNGTEATVTDQSADGLAVRADFDFHGIRKKTGWISTNNISRHPSTNMY